MRLRWRVRSMLISVALVAIGLAAWVALERRSEHFTHLAAYHLQAHGELVDQAGGPLQCLQLEGDEALEAVMEGTFAARGKQEYLAYKASTYHWDLFEKYRNAAARPWLSIEADPPPPPMANPRINADASYVQAVRDWDKFLSSGFQ